MPKIDELDISVQNKNGKYIALVPQLGLVAGGDTVLAAIEQLEKKKKSLAADMIEVGLTTDIEVSPALAFPTASSPAASETRQTSLLREVGGFGLKALLLIGILVVAGTAGVNSVIDNVRVSAREVANQFQHVGGSNFWRGVLKSIDEEADHDMPVEQKQHLLAQIRLIVQKWHPFIVEAAQLFAVDKSSAAGQPPK